MGLSRRRPRAEAEVWPGFVDALTTLLLVSMFVLTIFVGIQATLRDTITTQDSALDALRARAADLAKALGLEETRAADLAASLQRAEGDLAAERQLVATLQGDLSLAQSEGARLAAALSESEAAGVALGLDLEAARQRAEETLTLLAAAEGRERAAGALANERAALLALAEQKLSEDAALRAESARQVQLLNEQMAALRGQLQGLEAALSAAEARDEAAQVQIEALGARLNTALAGAASEARRRAALEAALRAKAEAEAKDLARYRSEFFGELRRLLDGRAGVRVVGDRFVFSSEVLFAPGSADLSPEGAAQIAEVAKSLAEIAPQIPADIPWILRVDGHTDDQALAPGGAFADNWALSQARALAVVRFLQTDLGFPPARLAATGFGEYQPVVSGTDAEARAQNRRIELKLTER